MPSVLLKTERSSLPGVLHNLPQQLFRHGRCNIFNNCLQIFKGARLHFLHIYRYLIPDAEVQWRWIRWVRMPVMISVSWNYPIPKFLLEKVEATSGNMTAGSILLEPVLLSRSYVPYSWPITFFQYLVQIHIAIHWTIEPHHWKTTPVDNAHSSYDFFTVCFIAFKHFMLVCWCPESVILRMWRWS